MSMMLMAQAMNMKVGNALRKLVLLKLADNANDQGECWPSYQHIADQCEIGRSTVKGHIKALAEMGFLRIELRRRGSGNSSNVYHLTLSKGKVPSTRGSIEPGQDMTGANDNPTRSASDPLTRSAADPRTSHSSEPVKNHTLSDANAPEHKVFETARQLDDQGQPLNAGSRFSMTEDWNPDVETIRCLLRTEIRMTENAVDALLNEHGVEALAKFRTKNLDQPGRQRSQRVWNREYASYLASWNKNLNLNRATGAQKTAPQGARHANSRNRTPIGDLDPAQARQLFEQQQREQQFGGSVYDGECEPGHG